jgi:hypothetical protein
VLSILSQIGVGYEAALDAGISAGKYWLKGKNTNFINERINNAATQPIAILTPNYDGGGNREYLMLSGIHKYNNRSRVRMKIGFSSGGIKIAWSNGAWQSPKTFTPHIFTINEAYILGSVKHNGTWQGIRMYIPK